MTCRKAQLLIGLYLAPAGGLSPKERQALEAHMAVCERCRRDCEESATGIALFQKHWHISEDTQALIDRAKRREAAGLPVDSLWRSRNRQSSGRRIATGETCNG
jgi:anti-sigma factor RsiW